MTRHRLFPPLRILLLRLLPLLVAALPTYAAEPESSTRPNIVLILADDLGWGDLGCYGQKRIRTPHLDRMAAEGMRFTRFYAGSTVCAPSRCVLMTGLHTGHARVRGNAGPANPGAQTLRPEDVTVAEVLRGAGHRTALFGKWGLGDALDGEGHPRRQGFDEFFGYLSQVHAHNHYPDRLVEDMKTVPLRNDLVPSGREGAGYSTNRLEYADDLFADRAVRFIGENRERPFFLFLSLVIPHANNERTRALGNGMEAPEPHEYTGMDWPEPDKGQAASVARVDAITGRVRAELEKHGLTRRTLVLFSSDNGPHAEGGNRPEFFQASGPWRGLKRSLTDGGVRVPFLACQPGTVPAGAVDSQVGWFADVMTTLARLAGAEPPPGTDGVDLTPALTGRGQGAARHPCLYWEFHEGKGGTRQAVLLDGRWKAIRAGGPGAPVTLYDQETDPGETRDAAAEHPETVKRAELAMAAERADSADWPLVKKPSSE